MINKVILLGRMTKDPELRRTNEGKAVTSFTLASDNGFGDNRKTDFINCVVWDKVAENVEKYCSKGSLVGVEGRISTRNYEGNDGKRVYVTEVVCNTVDFLSTNKEEHQSAPRQNKYEKRDASVDFDDNELNTFDIQEDDIQF